MATYISEIPLENSRQTEHFRLEPRKVVLPVAQGVSEKKQKHEPYKVKNHGYVDLKVELIHGSRDKIEGIVQTAIVKPGEEVTLNPGDSEYEHTALKVYNTSDDPAKFSVEGGQAVVSAEALAEDLPHAAS